VISTPSCLGGSEFRSEVETDFSVKGFSQSLTQMLW